ncbi:hypothetical protein SDRG_07779 [Saprolegnia diclina VS20]|uniref:FYVE-type domain-containing protein n=1 Tax=Saprolegnia diclina (strain VS20) TaxID=1156394 RepID=T0RRD0_SAPDV|nr:hypothetical protein SDRG_07779 [Saprolegnia diclina VS20]EQC34983.1 hypothetical protein SDRG_07779 [Saprolegnia diclina VS20]|eukprot:XP_008611855.1 hypothetical protein SDRG_07779 [Saprolegnia diclina VS20]
MADSSASVACPKCGSAITPNDKVCIYCGTTVGVADAPRSAPSAAVAAPTSVPAPPASAPTRRPVVPTTRRVSSNDNMRDSMDRLTDDIADLQKLWVPDDFSDDCMDCGKRFGFPQPRRHHCRVCGKLFCRECVMNKMCIPPSFGYGDKPQRCCKSCTISLQMKAIKQPADVFNQRQQMTAARGQAVIAAPASASSSDSAAPTLAANVPKPTPNMRTLANTVIATSRIKSGSDTNSVNLNDFATKNPTQVARAEQKECQICFRQFAIGRRAYHCQRCTRSVCNGCSQGQKPIPELGFASPVKHCNNCMSKPPAFASMEVEGCTEPLPGFEFLSKLDIKIGVADAGGETESYNVDAYFEPNAAHVKALGETLRASDIEAAKEYNLTRKRSMADFEWLAAALGDKITAKALPAFPEKRVARSAKKAQSLQVFLSGCLVHPLYRDCDALKAFFGLTNDQFRAFKNAGANTELRVAKEYSDVVVWLQLKMEQEQMENKLANLLKRKKDNEDRVSKQAARKRAHDARAVSQLTRREHINKRHEALVARKATQEARMAREKERLEIQQASVHIVYDDTKADEAERALEEDVRQKEKVEFLKSKDAFQNDTTEWNKDMAQWSRQRADWSDHHNPPVSKMIANEWIVKAFGISFQFQQLGLDAAIPKELTSLHVKVQQLQEGEPSTLEAEGVALDDEWSELSKERDHWAQDRTNMKREDDMCRDEDVRYKLEHEHVLMYRECRQDKMSRIERDLEALDMEIKSRNKAYSQRKLRHEALDKEYELEWKMAQDARMEYTSLRMAQHGERITRAKKRCETLAEQLARQQKSQRLLMFKRAAMNEERDADTGVFTEHKDGCKAAVEAAKSALAMAPEYVNRLNGDVDINSEETSDIVASNYRTPMEGDNVDERDHFMNDVRARRAQFQAELDAQQSHLASEHEVCQSLLDRISGFITRLSDETVTASSEDVLIAEYHAFLENEKRLVDDEEACREQKKAYLSSLMTDAGNWVLDALHDHSKRKKREADRLVKQAVRASELQRLVQHFTHRVIEQEERIMRQKQRILQGEHKLEMLKSSDSWFLYVTVHTPDIGKHDAKCLETARKEREEDMVQGGKLLNEDESDVNSVTSELEKSKACADEKAVKRDVWAYVEDVYNVEKPQEKDEDMMMTSQIRGLVAQLGETFEMLTNRLAEEDESLQHAYANLCSEVESIKCFMERIESEESALSTAEKASLQKEIQVRKAESDLIEQRARALNSNYKSIASEHAKLPVAFDGVRKTRVEREVPLKLRESELDVIRRLVKTRNYYDRKTCAEFAKKFVPGMDMKEVRDTLDWLLVAVDGDIKAVDRWMELSKGERKEMSLLATKASEIDWSADMLTKIPAFIDVDQMIKEKGAQAVHAKEQWVVDLINVKRAIASKDKDLCFVIDETLSAAKKEESKVSSVLDKLKASKEEVINTLRFIDQEEANAVRSGKPLEVETVQPTVVYQSNRKPMQRVAKAAVAAGALAAVTEAAVPEEQETAAATTTTEELTPKVQETPVKTDEEAQVVMSSEGVAVEMTI